MWQNSTGRLTLFPPPSLHSANYSKLCLTRPSCFHCWNIYSCSKKKHWNQINQREPHHQLLGTRAERCRFFASPAFEAKTQTSGWLSHMRTVHSSKSQAGSLKQSLHPIRVYNQPRFGKVFSGAHWLDGGRSLLRKGVPRALSPSPCCPSSLTSTPPLTFAPSAEECS